MKHSYGYDAQSSYEMFLLCIMFYSLVAFDTRNFAALLTVFDEMFLRSYETNVYLLFAKCLAKLFIFHCYHMYSVE